MGSNSNPSSTRKSEERAAFARQDSCAADGPFSPAGLKVLVVDDDPMCLKVVSAMLQRCNYEVETKNNGQDALALLRQRQEEGQQFDLVLSDVYMPDVDGFKLLESIGLELEVPVIMMSSDGDTNVVLRGVTHGAVDFLIKPVRIEELKNVWQHVVRRRSVHHARPGEEGAEFEGDSRTYGASGASGQGTKRKDTEPLRVEHEGGSGSKKPRVIWSVEMHQQFVNAVNALGIDKAVPKRILELMNVEGLTRENVASHLQKYRLYLKRVEGVATGKGGKLPRNTPGMMSAGVSGGQGMYHDASTMDEGSLRGGGDAAACIGAAAGGGGGGGGGGSSMDPNSAADLSQSAAAAAAAQQHHQAAAAYHQGAAAAAAAAAGYPPGMATTGQVAAAHMAAWQHQQMAMHAHAVAAAAMGGAPPGAHPFGIPHAAAANPYAAAAAMHHHNPPGSAPNPTAYGMPPHPPGAFCAPTGGVMHHHGPAVASYGAAPPQQHHHQQQQHHAGSATASHSSAFPPTSTPHNTNPHGGHPHPHQHQHHSHMPSSAHGCSAAGGVVDGSGYASGSNTNGNGGGGAPSGHKNNHHHHNNTNNTTNTNVGGQGNGNGSTNGSNFNGGSLGGANFTPNGGGNGSGRDSPDTVPMPFPGGGGGGGGGGVSCGHACCAGGGATSFLERAATDKKNGGKDAAYTCIHDQYGHHHHHGDFASGDPGAGGEAFLPPLAEGFLPPMDDVPGLGHLKEDPEGEFINMFIQGMEGVQGPGSIDGPDVVERGH